ncbi:sigma-70 family RNA polymerase sigma factor [Streptomyces sp. YPW6]|uniref:sigma-70 family RNA polymerase sigma factor n=1 Tax=Streptomyces sp. YPW6 TaxID=2840373 RepID=UPI003EBB8075
MTPPAPALPTAAQPAVPLAGVRSAAPASPPAGAPTARPPVSRPPVLRASATRTPRRRVPAARRNDGQITDWALAAGGGDREAADRFVRATYEDVRRFVAYLSSDSPGADDLAQETYLRAMSGLARFAGRSCARTWLMSIARRVVIDRHRAAAVRPRAADTADWQTAAERAQPRHLPGFDESAAVLDALRRLDPARRQAFVLTQLLGASYEEAAAAAGCPVGTVRSRVARARRELAGLWRGEPAGPADLVTAG